VVAQFELAVDGEDGTAVVTCRGDVDLSTCGELERAIESSLEPGVRVLRVDLHDLEFMDSTGLRSLMRAQRRCAEQGVRMELVVGAAVRRLLELTGALEQFTVVERSPT